MLDIDELMRILLLLFFTFTVPIAVLCTVVLYGEINNVTIKDALASGNVYKLAATHIQTLSLEDSDAQTEQFLTVIKKRVDAAYLQEKSEATIDTSYDFITSKSVTTPTLSFKEIKADIISQYPDLLPSLEQMAQEMEHEQQSQEQQPEDTSSRKQIRQFISFAKSDFTFPLEKPLTNVKNVYQNLKVIQPTLFILLLASLGGIFLLSSPLKSKLQWISATLTLSGVWGFVVIAASIFLTSALAQMLLGFSNQAATIATPIVLAIFQKFSTSFINIQAIVSISLFLIAAGVLTASVVSKEKMIPVKGVVKKK